MNEKLERIKEALRNAIELAEKAQTNRIDVGPFSTEQDKINGQHDTMARTFSPLMAKHLLDTIEDIQFFVERVEDGTARSKTTYQRFKNRLETICRDWP